MEVPTRDSSDFTNGKPFFERPDAAPPEEMENMPGVSRPNYCPGSRSLGGDKHSWDSYGDEWRCSFCPAVFRAALADSADAPEGPRMPMVECHWCGAEYHWRLWHDCPKRPSKNRLDAQQEG